MDKNHRNKIIKRLGYVTIQKFTPESRSFKIVKWLRTSSRGHVIFYTFTKPPLNIRLSRTIPTLKNSKLMTSLGFNSLQYLIVVVGYFPIIKGCRGNKFSSLDRSKLHFLVNYAITKFYKYFVRPYWIQQRAASCQPLPCRMGWSLKVRKLIYHFVFNFIRKSLLVLSAINCRRPYVGKEVLALSLYGTNRL